MRIKKGAQKYFEEILSIPRSSGKEEKIAGYLVYFAQQHNLEYEVDKYSNVIIRKKGTLPYKSEPIILQSHTDMVCDSNNAYDFDNKGIDWYIEDGFYKARDTTLGADNGVGVSIILAILHDSTLIHPPIEALFTSQEETTMNGAKFFDYKKIKGKRLISLDGTEINKIEVSSAGMASIIVESDIEETNSDLLTYQISINGLLGGHSGTDINKKRGNSIKILANILNGVDDIEIVSMNGGSKENVIPSTSKCIFKTKRDLSSDIKFFKDFYQIQYQNIKIDFRRMKQRETAISNVKSKNIIKFLNDIEDGVLKKNELGFPLTSSNIGVIETKKDKVIITASIRSSIVGFEEYYVSKLERISKRNKLNYILVDKKPFFTYKEESPLRQLLITKYEQLFNEKITLEDVHAGLEGGIFANEIKKLDMCVIGANLYDIHSVNEKVEIESINRVFEWLKIVLEEIE